MDALHHTIGSLDVEFCAGPDCDPADIPHQAEPPYGGGLNRASPIAPIAEQRFSQARFVSTLRVDCCLTFAWSELSKHSDVGLELLGQRTLQFPFDLGW